MRRIHAINLAPEMDGLHQPNPPKSLQNAPILNGEREIPVA
jgi:hypothetical protein